MNTASKFVHAPPVKLTLYADASLEGWGGTDTVSDVGGRWSENESPAHINILELLAAKLVLHSLGKDLSYCHIFFNFFFYANHPLQGFKSH